MKCPKCNAEMSAVTVGEYTVDRCNGCGGLWFDLLEYERIAESKSDVKALDTGDPAVGAKQNLNPDVSCPICHVKMLRLSVPDQLHIKYESCPVCFGAFFDAGEFKDYASHMVGEQISSFFKGFRRKKAK